MTNQELMEKATITTAAMANAGKLNAAQSDRFIDYVIEETTNFGARVVRFSGEESLIEKIGVGNRVAVPKAEAADPGVRRGISTSKVTLSPKEVMVPFEIGDLAKEYSIEGGKMEDTVIRLMARQLANNLEELYWEGCSNGPAALESDLIDGGSGTLYRKDTYLALFDGWLKAAESANVVDAQNGDISQAVFGKALRAMPNKFKRNKAALRWLMSMNHEQRYREGLSNRPSALGDAAINSSDSPRPFGVQMVPVSLLPENPRTSEDVVANNDGSTATSLGAGPITDLVLTPQNLSLTPTAKYALGTDYTQDLAAGTFVRLTGGVIPSAGTIKASYRTAGKMVLSDPSNFILAIGRAIRIEKARNIYRTVNEFAITARVYCTFEELTAAVLVKNIKIPE